MATLTVTGFMHYKVCKYDHTESFSFFGFDASKHDSEMVLVGPHSFEYTPPADFKPIASRLDKLQQQRDAACKQFADTVRAIDEQIGKLTAICNEVTS